MVFCTGFLVLARLPASPPHAAERTFGELPTRKAYLYDTSQEYLKLGGIIHSLKDLALLLENLCEHDHQLIDFILQRLPALQVSHDGMDL